MKYSIKNHNLPIHQEGWIFILIAVIITGIGYYFTGYAIVPLVIFVVAFFRNPSREIPKDKNAVVSPADGKVVKIDKVQPPAELKNKFKGDPKKLLRIAVFMNVINVHVNRSPIDGKVIDTVYTPGKFFNASLDKASLNNERLGYIIEGEKGRQIIIVQIAGLIARRIVSWKKAKDNVKRGERIGLIRFGSRVDVYLPETVKVNVSIGQKINAGSDILAFLI